MMVRQSTLSAIRHSLCSVTLKHHKKWSLTGVRAAVRPGTKYSYAAKKERYSPIPLPGLPGHLFNKSMYMSHFLML